MHYLHKILVHIPSAINKHEIASKEELLDKIITYAQSETERFDGTAFDWRDVDSAGGWTDEYPQQAYIAADNLEWFINELREVVELQRKEIDYYLNFIQEAANDNLAVLSDNLWKRGSPHTNFNNNYRDDTIAYYLLSLAKHLYGEYRFNSYFYNTYNSTARLYEIDFEMIKRSPGDWALVVFDYHY